MQAMPQRARGGHVAALGGAVEILDGRGEDSLDAFAPGRRQRFAESLDGVQARQTLAAVVDEAGEKLQGGGHAQQVVGANPLKPGELVPWVVTNVESVGWTALEQCMAEARPVRQLGPFAGAGQVGARRGEQADSRQPPAWI